MILSRLKKVLTFVGTISLTRFGLKRFQMAKRRPSGQQDNRQGLDKNAYIIDDTTGQVDRATHDELSHSKLDSLISQGSALNTLKSLSYNVTNAQIELKSDTNKLPGRQVITIYNNSNATLYYGPTGVSVIGTSAGMPLLRQQMVSIPASELLAVFIIANAGSHSIIVQEWGL